MGKFLLIVLGIVSGLIVAAIIGFAILYRFVFIVPTLDAEPTDTASITAWLDDLHARNRFNGVVLLRLDGETVIRDAWGDTSAAQDIPLTVATPMRLASVSKAFTATGILTLADQGRIDLDEPIGTYLDDCDLPGVTARHLMSQTSGLTDDYMRLGFGPEASDAVVDSQTVLDFVCAKEDPFSAEPGTAYSYSNTDYVLLAALAERITGERFEAFMRRDVFDRLGLEQTRIFNLRSEPGGLPVADTFSLYPQPKARYPMTNIDGVAGDGAVFSSLSDLERWANLWRTGGVLSPDLQSAAVTAGDGSYGFGWVVQGDRVWHNGRWLGAQSYLEWRKDRDDLLIVVDNGDGVALDGIVETLSGLIADR